jgi:hypothetical protein
LQRDFRCAIVPPVPMTRNLCCLVLTCLVTACAPKGVEVPEAAVTPPKRNNNKPAVATTDAPPPDMPRVVNPDGMVVPDIVNRLPDRNDMTPTAPPVPTGGGVIATPPAPRKPVNE